MDLNRETAMRLWNKSFGKETKVNDFAGRTIAKGAYNDRNSEFGWNVDHIFPQSKGGVTADHNLICCHIKTNDEKADKFPCFTANEKPFEIVKSENHYEIRSKSNSDKKNETRDEKTNFFDSASGIALYQLLKRHQGDQRFAGVVFINLRGISKPAIYDFIQLLMESEDFSCVTKNGYDNMQDAKIILKGDFFPRKDDIAALFDKCILLNTYLKHYFLPKGDVESYDIFYRVDAYKNSIEMYNRLEPLEEITDNTHNSLYISHLVWLNTEAKQNMEWNTSYEYKEYDYYYTKLSKNLDKEVKGK